MDHRRIAIDRLEELGAVLQLCYIAKKNNKHGQLAKLLRRMEKIWKTIDGLGISVGILAHYGDKADEKITVTSVPQPEGYERFSATLEIFITTLEVAGSKIYRRGNVEVGIFTGDADEVPASRTQKAESREPALSSESETADILRQFGITAA